MANRRKKAQSTKTAKHLTPLVLIISSEVAYGHVGASATVPALQALGFETALLPTVIYSNHPGYGRFAGQVNSVKNLQALFDELHALGVLERVCAVLTGYFSAPAQIKFAAQIIDDLKTRNKNIVFCCDPVAGDNGHLYVKENVVRAIAKYFLPRADILTPNHFELGYLTRQKMSSLDDVLRAAASLKIFDVLVTSAANTKKEIATFLVSNAPPTAKALITWTHRYATAPHGLGDSMSALYLGWRLQGQKPQAALTRAQAGLSCLIDTAVKTNTNELKFAGQALALARPNLKKFRTEIFKPIS